MAEPPEVWTFAAANVVSFVFGAVLTGVSYLAYRYRGRSASFLYATLGFGTITAGGLAEPVYQLGFKTDNTASGRELLALQTIEGLLVAAGLGLLFYSIYEYDRRVGSETRSGERLHDSR